MHGKTHENIKTIRPLKDGVIADFDAAEHMIRGMIKMISPKGDLLRHWKWLFVFHQVLLKWKNVLSAIPRNMPCEKVYLIHEPMAAAIGIGIDVEEPMGNMIIDIGGGTSEIAVIALGGIVCDQSIPCCGWWFHKWYLGLHASSTQYPDRREICGAN